MSRKAAFSSNQPQPPDKQYVRYSGNILYYEFVRLNSYQSRIRHFWLYALRLEHGKYYVGVTTNFVVRFRQHGGPYGARWTKAHKPLEVLELHDLSKITNYKAEQIEQGLFEEYREQYGVRNVRGGRIVSTGSVFRVGKFYFNRQMLEAFSVALLLMLCGLILAVRP